LPTINISNMTLEEKFEALMKNFEPVTLTNKGLKTQIEELKNQIRYLKKQLGSNMKQEEFEGKLDPDMSSLNGYTWLSVSLSVRKFLKIRRLSWLLLGSESAPPYGGWTYVLKE